MLFFTRFTLTNSNPYLQQLVEQTGATPAELRSALTPLLVTEQAAQEYEEALHEFLNGL